MSAHSTVRSWTERHHERRHRSDSMSTGRLRTWLPTSHSEAHEAARDCLRRIVRATHADLADMETGFSTRPSDSSHAGSRRQVGTLLLHRIRQHAPGPKRIDSPAPLGTN